MENTEKTIIISIDEYFELRQRAEMNNMVLEKLSFFEGRMCEFDRRIFDLEQRMKGE